MDFVIKYWYYFLALAVVLYLLVAGPASQFIYGIKSITPSQAILMLNRNAGVILDVCEPKDFDAAHIPKSVNIPAATLPGRMKELEKYKDEPVVVTCRTGNRSIKGAMLLRKNGYQSVYTLAGGFLSWQKDNLPLDK